MSDALKVYVIQIEQVGPQFHALLNKLLFQLLATHGRTGTLQETQQRIVQIYQETIRQIFDCMSEDFSDFSLNILSLPNYTHYLDMALFSKDPQITVPLELGIKELAIGIHLALRQQGAFSFGRYIMLDQPGPDYLVLHLHP